MINYYEFKKNKNSNKKTTTTKNQNKRKLLAFIRKQKQKQKKLNENDEMTIIDLLIKQNVNVNTCIFDFIHFLIYFFFAVVHYNRIKDKS